MSGLVLAALLWVGLTWLAIRADSRDQEAHELWMDDPRHVWNPTPTTPPTSEAGDDESRLR